MGKRKLPFGYQMVNGKVVICPVEAKIVSEIFRRYTQGASFLNLERWLRSQQVRYEAARLWNKNMVARILSDRRYTGTDMFPPLVSEEMFDRAEAVRREKQRLSEKTEAQKLLRKLSGNAAERAVESQTLMLLNRLIARPEQIRSAPQKTVSIKEMELQRELDALMQVQPVEEERAAELAVRLAAAQYERLGTEEYETERLKRLLKDREPMTELDAGLLKASLSRVEVTGVSVRLWLKNGQCIERNPTE